jgi:hypothetical protein
MLGGGQLRTVSLFEYLRSKGEVDAIVFHADPLPGEYANVLHIDLPYHSRSIPAKLWRNGVRLLKQVPPLVDRFSGYETQIADWLRDRHYDLALFEHFWVAPYLDTVRPHAARCALDLHNIESVWLRRMRVPFAGCARRLEDRWLPKFDAILTASAHDSAQIPVRSFIYPNAIPVQETPLTVPEANVVAMSGNFEFPPNAQGARWLAREVMPRLSGVELRLIGKHSERMPFGGATGTIPNAIEELAKATVAAVPIFAGSGTRLKIVEAWAAGTPVISTTVGCEGLDCRDGRELLIRDTPQSFAAAIRELLASPGERAKLAEEGRKRYLAEFTWPAAWERLENCRALY